MPVQFHRTCSQDQFPFRQCIKALSPDSCFHLQAIGDSLLITTHVGETRFQKISHGAGIPFADRSARSVFDFKNDKLVRKRLRQFQSAKFRFTVQLKDQRIATGKDKQPRS